MNTSFSLIYFECEKSIAELTGAINGPELFSSRTAAIDKLFLYVEARLTDGLEDVLEQYIEDTDALRDADSVDVMKYIKDDCHEKLAVIEHYFEYMQDDLCHAGFSIEELPTSSFMEQLNVCNAIEINGNFIRHFNILSSDEMACGDIETYFDASFIDDNHNKFEFEFSIDAILSAHYDTAKKRWRVSGYDVTLINFSQ